MRYPEILIMQVPNFEAVAETRNQMNNFYPHVQYVEQVVASLHPETNLVIGGDLVNDPKVTKDIQSAITDHSVSRVSQSPFLVSYKNQKNYLSKDAHYLKPGEAYIKTVSDGFFYNTDVRNHVVFNSENELESHIFHLLLVSYTYNEMVGFEYHPSPMTEAEMIQRLFDFQDRYTNVMSATENPEKWVIYMPVALESRISHNLAIIDNETSHIIGYEPRGQFHQVCRRRAEAHLASKQHDEITFEEAKFISPSSDDATLLGMMATGFFSLTQNSPSEAIVKKVSSYVQEALTKVKNQVYILLSFFMLSDPSLKKLSEQKQ